MTNYQVSDEELSSAQQFTGSASTTGGYTEAEVEDIPTLEDLKSFVRHLERVSEALKCRTEVFLDVLKNGDPIPHLPLGEDRRGVEEVPDSPRRSFQEKTAAGCVEVGSNLARISDVLCEASKVLGFDSMIEEVIGRGVTNGNE